MYTVNVAALYDTQEREVMPLKEWCPTEVTELGIVNAPVKLSQPLNAPLPILNTPVPMVSVPV